jgi:urease accessory protein UreH
MLSDPKTLRQLPNSLADSRSHQGTPFGLLEDSNLINFSLPLLGRKKKNDRFAAANPYTWVILCQL